MMLCLSMGLRVPLRYIAFGLGLDHCKCLMRYGLFLGITAGVYGIISSTHLHSGSEDMNKTQHKTSCLHTHSCLFLAEFKVKIYSAFLGNKGHHIVGFRYTIINRTIPAWKIL